MKVGLCLLFMLVLGMTRLSAQDITARRDAQRGPGLRSPPVRSPGVSADGRITFRLRAPGAREVFVRGIGQAPLPTTAR